MHSARFGAAAPVGAGSGVAGGADCAAPRPCGRQTPDEMYFGTGDGVPEQLEAARKEARQRRLEENRARSCPACDAA